MFGFRNIICAISLLQTLYDRYILNLKKYPFATLKSTFAKKKKKKYPELFAHPQSLCPSTNKDVKNTQNLPFITSCSLSLL